MALSLINSYGNSQCVVMDTTNHALAFCLSKELNYIHDHISNIKAGLKTWQDHLLRIQELEKMFDSLLLSLEPLSTEIQEFLKSESVNKPETEKTIMVRFSQSLNKYLLL